jgi:ATPase family protein associated with various cellular activities (AAA)
MATSINGAQVKTSNCSLLTFALAALASSIPPESLNESHQEEYLRECIAATRRYDPDLTSALSRYIGMPQGSDLPLFKLAEVLELSVIEMLSVALAAAVEENVLIGRLLAYFQSPIASSRPTFGLLARAFAVFMGNDRPIDALSNGNAIRSGLLLISQDDVPLPERTVSVALPTCLALHGQEGIWPNSQIGIDDSLRIPLPHSTQETARMHALSLSRWNQKLLVIRTGNPAEGRAVADLVANFLDKQPLFIYSDKQLGLTPWLLLNDLVPVFCMEIAPGERRTIAPPPLYKGPLLALAGRDGELEFESGLTLHWTLGVPALEEREHLWECATEQQELARVLAPKHRHTAGRIWMLGQLAREQAMVAGHRHVEEEDVDHVARSGEGTGLNSLAELITEQVSEKALVLAEVLRVELETLCARCTGRDLLDRSLGESMRARYRPSVRALFVGPSGTGKTMAAIWLATKLGLPLYRVDLAAITSKYVGETEKNLSLLLTRAEESEVLLLFDEADSLFGKRTDIRDSNDRFANAQTNYLLQRMESFNGIAILTSNTASRFDTAFSRRFDMVVEFPLPGAEERRELWTSHLGEAHQLSEQDINRIAVTADLAGGQIRNAVLTAAVAAHSRGGPIKLDDVIHGLKSEYRKLARQIPDELRTDFTQR